jgi:hypothetical protein
MHRESMIPLASHYFELIIIGSKGIFCSCSSCSDGNMIRVTPHLLGPIAHIPKLDGKYGVSPMKVLVSKKYIVKK